MFQGQTAWTVGKCTLAVKAERVEEAGNLRALQAVSPNRGGGLEVLRVITEFLSWERKLTSPAGVEKRIQLANLHQMRWI